MFWGTITQSSPRQVPHLPQCSYGLDSYWNTTALFLVKDSKNKKTLERSGYAYKT